MMKNMKDHKVVIGLVNFQSITKANLSFRPGLNVIIGPNSSGKSAIFRAIRSLILNPSGAKRYIKHGTDYTRVALQIPGFDRPVFWERHARAKHPVDYYVGKNTEPFTAMGTKKLHDIVPDFPFIVEGDSSSARILQLHDEWSILFPFDRNSAGLFKLFESIFHISSSSKVLEEMKRDEKSTRQAVTILESQVNLNSSKIQGIEEFCSAFGEETLQEKIDAIELIASQTSQLQVDLDFILNFSRKRKVLATIPEFLTADLESIAHAGQITGDLNQAASLENSLAVELKYKDFDLADVMSWLDVSKDLSAAANIAENLEIKVEHRDFDLSDLESLSEATYDLLEAEDVDKLLLESNTVILDLSRQVRELEIKLQEFKTCPLCKTEFKERHVHV